MHRRHDMSRKEPSEDLSRRWFSIPKLPKRPRMECTPEEFRSKLEDFFRPYILSARSDGNFDSVCVSTASHDFAQHLRSPELASVYYSYVVQECYEFISVDKTTMFKTLKECIAKKLEVHGFGKDPFDRFRYASPDRRLNRLHSFEVSAIYDDESDYYTLNRLFRLYVKEKQKRILVPYYARDITGCTLEQLLCKPFLYQDFECIKNLLLYIMPVTFATDDLCYFRHDVIRRIEIDPSLRGARYCKSLFDEYCNNYSARRVKLLLMSIDFMVQKRCESNFAQECINSLKLVLSTIPDAMITSEEVSRFLLSIVNHVDCSSELVIKDFCSSFEEEFPLSALPLQPRSLKHLCKCEIRKTLSSVQQLPVGIGRMGIPIAVQKYLSLE